MIWRSIKAGAMATRQVKMLEMSFLPPAATQETCEVGAFSFMHVLCHSWNLIRTRHECLIWWMMQNSGDQSLKGLAKWCNENKGGNSYIHCTTPRSIVRRRDGAGGGSANVTWRQCGQDQPFWQQCRVKVRITDMEHFEGKQRAVCLCGSEHICFRYCNLWCTYTKCLYVMSDGPANLLSINQLQKKTSLRVT